MPTMPFFPKFYSVLPKANRFDYLLKKNNRRKARKNYLSEEDGRIKSKPVHAIRDIYPWKNKEQFVDHLAENVIYNKDGLIAINKPYGVPLLKNGLIKGSNESLFSIEEALTPLASLLNVEKLLPAKMVERFASGISLFASKEKVIDKIRQSYINNKSKKIYTFKYLAVTIGEPKPSSSRGTVGMGFFEHQDIEKKLLAIMKDYSNKKVADGLVREFRVDYKTLSRGDEPCSLVEIDVSSTKNHFLRVYLAHLFSPVLGDHIYGNRVQDIMGKRLAISPLQADSLSVFQKIPAEILTRLKVTESGIVPNCLHLSQMTLSKFASKDSNLVLKADPPPCFQYICQTFGLDLPTDESVVVTHM
ncbi:mitochondrial mRNA pseudouridine synthase RPUSD3-like [Daphnia carinata]|uniref:mitochondrial mRNA pseudouridine synthase RPUSD3-like n=1 Tax=Daphnia carinata TaxID=120202 RepID=UPI00257E9D60|nr:mitochondrial mRNA pseudouridine synthase RPUSD3-like [Daphnia carinata]